MKKALLVVALLFVHCFTATEVWAANVLFSQATVGLVEVRPAAWGSFIIFTLSDSSGNRIMKLCDTAVDVTAIAIPISDPGAKLIMGAALTAKLSGKTVIGWGIDPPAGLPWCGIGNFAIEP